MPDGVATTEKALLSRGEYSLSGGHEGWTSALPDGLSLTNLRLLWGSGVPGRGMEIGLADVRCVGEDGHIDLAVGEADIHVRIGVPPGQTAAVASGLSALAANARYQDAIAPPTDHAIDAARPEVQTDARGMPGKTIPVGAPTGCRGV